MRNIYITEYPQITGGEIKSQAEFRAGFETCIRTPVPESVEEQLGACQDVVDYIRKNIAQLQVDVVFTNHFLVKARIDKIQQALLAGYQSNDEL